jgi:hypothetical protein
MLPGHETPPRAGRSGFVAAFLSLLFPGLGHAYLGAYRRGLGFCAADLIGVHRWRRRPDERHRPAGMAVRRGS